MLMLAPAVYTSGALGVKGSLCTLWPGLLAGSWLASMPVAAAEASVWGCSLLTSQAEAQGSAGALWEAQGWDRYHTSPASEPPSEVESVP